MYEHQLVEYAERDVREVVPPGTPLRPSLVDPYRAFIRETLEKYPTLTASRLHDMVCERGYAGRASHFRYLVSTMRPRPPAEAFLRLRTLPGEQMVSFRQCCLISSDSFA